MDLQRNNCLTVPVWDCSVNWRLVGNILCEVLKKCLKNKKKISSMHTMDFTLFKGVIEDMDIQSPKHIWMNSELQMLSTESIISTHYSKKGKPISPPQKECIVKGLSKLKQNSC